uniref:C2 domain-containing protein n=1 Tax=Mesocestoides corti TaxID=53468 RepID=A0A5K3G1G2_MESCO
MTKMHITTAGITKATECVPMLSGSQTRDVEEDVAKAHIDDLCGMHMKPRDVMETISSTVCSAELFSSKRQTEPALVHAECQTPPQASVAPPTKMERTVDGMPETVQFEPSERAGGLVSTSVLASSAVEEMPDLKALGDFEDTDYAALMRSAFSGIRRADEGTRSLDVRPYEVASVSAIAQRHSSVTVCQIGLQMHPGLVEADGKLAFDERQHRERDRQSTDYCKCKQRKLRSTAASTSVSVPAWQRDFSVVVKRDGMWIGKSMTRINSFDTDTQTDVEICDTRADSVQEGVVSESVCRGPALEAVPKPSVDVAGTVSAGITQTRRTSAMKVAEPWHSLHKETSRSVEVKSTSIMTSVMIGGGHTGERVERRDEWEGAEAARRRVVKSTSTQYHSVVQSRVGTRVFEVGPAKDLGAARRFVECFDAGVQAQLPAPSQFVEVEPGSVVVRRSSAVESQARGESGRFGTRLDQHCFPIDRRDTPIDESLDTADLDVRVAHLTVSQSTQTFPAGGVDVFAHEVDKATQIV